MKPLRKKRCNTDIVFFSLFTGPFIICKNCLARACLLSIINAGAIHELPLH